MPGTHDSDARRTAGSRGPIWPELAKAPSSDGQDWVHLAARANLTGEPLEVWRRASDGEPDSALWANVRAVHHANATHTPDAALDGWIARLTTCLAGTARSFELRSQALTEPQTALVCALVMPESSFGEGCPEPPIPSDEGQA